MKRYKNKQIKIYMLQSNMVEKIGDFIYSLNNNILKIKTNK